MTSACVYDAPSRCGASLSRTSASVSNTLCMTSRGLASPVLVPAAAVSIPLLLLSLSKGFPEAAAASDWKASKASSSALAWSRSAFVAVSSFRRASSACCASRRASAEASSLSLSLSFVPGLCVPPSARHDARDPPLVYHVHVAFTTHVHKGLELLFGYLRLSRRLLC
jgi:hypothetical protein